VLAGCPPPRGGAPCAWAWGASREPPGGCAQPGGRAGEERTAAQAARLSCELLARDLLARNRGVGGDDGVDAMADRGLRDRLDLAVIEIRRDFQRERAHEAVAPGECGAALHQRGAELVE